MEEFCKNEVEKALVEAEAERNDAQPREPIVRLRINRALKSGEGSFEMLNRSRFGEQFKGVNLCLFQSTTILQQYNTCYVS